MSLVSRPLRVRLSAFRSGSFTIYICLSTKPSNLKDQCHFFSGGKRGETLAKAPIAVNPQSKDFFESLGRGSFFRPPFQWRKTGEDFSKSASPSQPSIERFFNFSFGGFPSLAVGLEALPCVERKADYSKIPPQESMANVKNF